MGERIMLLDGAMGTTIQEYKFSEEDFRGAPWEVVAYEFEPGWHARPAYSTTLSKPTGWQATNSLTSRRLKS